MKLFYICVLLSFSCSSANEKKKGFVNNGEPVNNGQLVDMGSDTKTASDVSTNTDSGMTKTDAEPNEDLGVEPDVDPPNRAPEIGDFSIRPPSISEGESFTIRVEVRDRDGNEDIKNAQLIDRDQNNYGVFTSEGNSAYSKIVSWNEINSLRPITFANQSAIDFIAIFEDTANHSADVEISGNLTCNGDPACQGTCGQDLCAGTCRDLSRDPNHCGQCSKVCDAGCTNGTCDPVGGQENYGELCTVDTDCTDSLCVLVNSPFFVGNVCAKSCTQDLQCNGEAICADLTALQLGQFCANTCDPQNMCPVGMNCVDGIANESICSPL